VPAYALAQHTCAGALRFLLMIGQRKCFWTFMKAKRRCSWAELWDRTASRQKCKAAQGYMADAFSACIRHRPFGIAGDWHRIPFLVRAPHRRLTCIGNLLCMGLIL
jgi:hypothetical protein